MANSSFAKNKKIHKNNSRCASAPEAISKPKRRVKLEIKFDAKARREFLNGFSSRKQKRRTFGLAMQKVKDRKTKLEQRKELRQAQLEKLEELEEQQKIDMTNLFLDQEEKASSSKIDIKSEPETEQALVNNVVPIEESRADEIDSKEEAGVLQSFFGEKTNTGQQQSDVKVITAAESSSLYGGRQVIVTTTYGLLEDSDDEADRNALARRKKQSGVDLQQRQAGSVKRYIAALKGKQKIGHKRVATKGKHGASNMAGIGGAANLKLAKKTLAKAQAQLKRKGGAPVPGRTGAKKR